MHIQFSLWLVTRMAHVREMRTHLFKAVCKGIKNISYGLHAVESPEKRAHQIIRLQVML